MLVKTKYFGEIDLSEDKVITFDNGIMGFEKYKRYTLLFDEEEKEEAVIMWLQSLDEETLALPVINPLYVDENYNPQVDDELLAPLEKLTEENLCVLITLTVPSDPKEMTANLKAPLIINSDIRKGCQLIVENKEYEIRYKAFEAIRRIRQMKGGE